MKKQFAKRANQPLHSEDTDLTGINRVGRNERGQFATGNPGRPVGSRNKLSEQFLSALAADWEQHGVEVLQNVRKDRPADYLRVIASVLPKEMHVAAANDLEEMSDEELEYRTRELARELGFVPADAAH